MKTLSTKNLEAISRSVGSLSGWMNRTTRKYAFFTYKKDTEKAIKTIISM